MISLLFGLSLAFAHHNKGLPHYGYFENYPQVPTEEYIKLDGRWEAGATIFNFQGLDSRGSSETPNDVKFYSYIYDLELDKGYEGAIELSILQDDIKIMTWDRIEPDGEGVYITRETLPTSGNYKLLMEFEVDGKKVRLTLPFYADLAVDRVDWWIVSGIIGGVCILFFLALAGKKNQLRTSVAPKAEG